MWLPIFAVCAIIHQASGHGWLRDPVGRSSAWRLGFGTPKNYDDNALFCGGFSTQKSNGGKCGVCGDPWVRDGAQRENEAGGRYAKGVIVKHYKMGQTINIKVDLTANHFGWMEFRICPNNDYTKRVTHECLNKHVLQRADGTGTKTMINSKRTGVWNMAYKLPDGMTCTQCVLQWKYHAGNSWGVDKDTGKACVGCGDQEEFYGCSDVAIEGNDAVPQQVTERPTPRPTPRPTQRPTPRATQRPTQRPTPRPTQRPTQPPLVDTHAPIGFIPLGPKMQTNKPPVQTPKEFIGMKTQCKGINNWANDPDMDRWCTDNCAIGNCPVYGCDCSGGLQVVTDKMTQPPRTTIRPTTQTTTTTTPKPTTTSTTTTTTPKPTTTSTTTTTTPKPTITTTTTTAKPTQAATQVINRVECKAINLWAGNEYLNRWCADHCARGDCPPDECKCITIQKIVTQSTTTTLLPEKVGPVAKTAKVCHALSFWTGIAVFDQWCNDNCNSGNCPKDTCECTEIAEQPISTTTTTTTTTMKPDVTSHGKCSSNGVVSGDYWDGWCQQSCDRGNCESDYCVCNM